jgi:archaellum biogenesis ATPase FlaH
VKSQGIPESKAGAWARPNPCKKTGSGSNGAVTDADIARHKFLLIESDTLPVETQLAFYSKLKLPVAAILSSGGKSAHCWIHMGCETAETYEEFAGKIMGMLQPFGFDTSNKNPSRLSRLPGATRAIQATSDGCQRLYFLNPAVGPVTRESLEAFGLSLSIPALDNQPLRHVIRESYGRYEELYENRGKLGVPTGLVDFDRQIGGLKAGHFIVIAAETGGGKSTIAMNWINHALGQGIGVAMFSIEMDRDELLDNLLSIRNRVNRNKFNTGEFDEQDLGLMKVGLANISKLPFWIFDDAIITVEQISQIVTQLRSEHNIGLAVVDYIQLVTPDNTSEIREQQVAKIANGLRAVAKANRLPIVVLSQLNEEGKIRESRAIAHAANMMILLEDLDGNKPRLKIVKGRRVEKKAYDLFFNREFCQVHSAAKVQEQDVPRRNYDQD